MNSGDIDVIHHQSPFQFNDSSNILSLFYARLFIFNSASPTFLLFSNFKTRISHSINISTSNICVLIHLFNFNAASSSSNSLTRVMSSLRNSIKSSAVMGSFLACCKTNNKNTHCCLLLLLLLFVIFCCCLLFLHQLPLQRPLARRPCVWLVEVVYEE
jgi:hypothetical protein